MGVYGPDTPIWGVYRGRGPIMEGYGGIWPRYPCIGGLEAQIGGILGVYWGQPLSSHQRPLIRGLGPRWGISRACARTHARARTRPRTRPRAHGCARTHVHTPRWVLHVTLVAQIPGGPDPLHFNAILGVSHQCSPHGTAGYPRCVYTIQQVSPVCLYHAPV